MRLHAVLFCLVFQFPSGLPYPQGGCQHSGRMHRDGSEVAMADPCVKCRCVRGVLVCRLRVCAPQPHPPPPGCIVLSRRSECCPRLVCSQEGAELSRRRLSDNLLDDRSIIPSGCLVNGSVYAEGSAMDTSSRCQYCYCIRGRQHCVRPQCVLAETDCVPSYSTDSCCPAKYNCSGSSTSGGVRNKSTSTTTFKPISGSGCRVEGREYPEGELIPDETTPCQHCYCLKGQPHCEPVVCSVPVNKHCEPVLTAGHCCPTSYNCSSGGVVEGDQEDSQEDMIALNTQSISVNHLYVNSERSITNKAGETNNYTQPQTQPFPNDSTTSSEDTTTLETTVTTMKEEATTMEEESKETTAITTEVTPTTTDKDVTVMSTTITDFVDAEQRINLKRGEDMTTSRMEELIVTTISSDTNSTSTLAGDLTKDSKLDPTYGPEKSLPSDVEAILNQTNLASKDEDYNDYDYNESSLPPSLPNLRIIPFVAADAVVEEPQFKTSLDKSHILEDLHFYEGGNHPHGFSPPVETEGGFVPKEPLLDGPFYESKFDGVYHSTGNNGASLSLDISSDTLSSLPAITEPPKVMEEEKCVRGGHSYRHGELLSDPSACELCVCYYGKVICQEPKCPGPDPGCRLLHERDHTTCCRKVICSGNSIESPTRVVEHVTAAAHMPPFTVADVIVTPDPFRDVIRTEAAPDLHSLIGDIMPYLWDQSTSSTTPVSFTTLESRENSTTTSTTSSTTSSTTTTTTTTTPSTTTTTTPSTTTTTTREPSTTESTSTTSTTLPVPTTTLTSLFDLLNFESTNKTVPQEEYDYKEVKEEEPSEDDFSFDSVFSYLFGNDKWTTTSEKPYPKTKKPYLSKPPNVTQGGDQKFLNKTVGPKFNQSRPSTEQTLEHRIDVDIDDPTNSLDKISELDKTSSPTAASPLSNSETRRTTNAEPIIKLIATTPVVTLTSSATTTNKPTEQVVYHTSVRNILTTPPSSTSHRPTEKTAYYSTVRNPITKASTKRYGTKYTSTPKYSRPPVTPATSLSKPDPGAASGLLKLAGCNIYGRMYRVGRIISELSGPCLECMCTEVGVQCRPLKC